MAVTITGSHAAEKKRAKGPSGGLSMKIAAGAACAALLAGGTFLFLGFRDYKSMADSRDGWTEISVMASGQDAAGAREPEQFIEVPLAPGPDGTEFVFDPSSAQAVYDPEDLLYKSIDLPAIQALNPYVSGYIYIPGTPIDYPVMKEVEPGQYFYIDHNIYNKYDKYGSIFELCDEERGEDSAVTWVFGHHMSSGSMFSGLYNFLDPEFAGTHIYIYRDGYRSEYEAFGACVVDMHDSAYSFGDYARGSDAYAALLAHLEQLDRLPDNDTEWPGADSDITILSTCYGGSGTRERLIVLCREVRRAVVPDYYSTLQEVQEYGGSQDPVDADEAAPASGVDGSGDLAGITDLAGTGT